MILINSIIILFHPNRLSVILYLSTWLMQSVTIVTDLSRSYAKDMAPFLFGARL